MSYSLNKWKIAFLVPGDIHSLTGGYIYDKQVLEYFQRQEEKYTVRLFATPKPKIVTDILYNIWLMVLLGNRFDVVIEDGMSFRQTFLFNSLCKILSRKTSIVGIIHMIFAPVERRGYSHRISRMVEGRWMNSLDTVIVNSRNTLLEAKKQLHSENHRILIAPPGYQIISKAFSPKGANPSKSDHVVILYVGQIIRRKGLHLLLEALAPLAELNWELNVVGDLNCDKDYLSEVTTLVEQFGLAHKVRLMGELSRTDVKSKLESSDVFVSSSMYEAFGMSVLEALANGVPVVAFAVGGITEIVEHNVTGLLVRPGDIEALRGALRKIISDQALRLELSKQAKKRIDVLPTWESTCSLIEGNLIQTLSAKDA
jgi:glycosyltransferase involved in cell wall biosynthesis